jgi:uncharacterized protein involved in outer membrane biogenesis
MRKRKVLVFLGVSVICLAIATLTLWASFDVNRYRPQIEASLQEKFGRDVHLGEMHVSFLPLGFRVHKASISESPAFGAEHSFAEVDMLTVRPRVFPLLRGVVEIQSVLLSHPSLEVIRNEKGVWNFTTLLEGRPLSLAKLKVEDGRVSITDQLERQPRAVYDHIDLTLYDYVPGKAFSIEAQAHLPGSGEQIIAFNGAAGPIQHDSITSTPLDGKLELREVALSALQRFLKTEALVNSDAVLTGKSEIKNNGTLASKGHVEIRDARIRGVQLGYTVTADYDISSDTVEKTVAIRRTNLKLDDTSMSVDGRINSATTPATLDLHVQASEGSIGGIARLAAALGIAFNKAGEVTGRLSFDVGAKGPITRPVFEGNVSARDVRITGGEVREPVEVSSIDLALSPTLIRSNPFTATTGRTRVAAQVAVDGYATDTPQLRASINTSNAELGEVIRVARAYGLSGEDGMTGSGAITLQVSVSGPMKQTERWTYSGTGAVGNASLRLPSLAARPLEVSKAKLRFAENSLVVEDLQFSIGETTAHGNLTAHNLASPRVEFSLAADKINAAEWQEMAKPRPEEAGASSVRNGARTSLLARATGSGQLSAKTVAYDQLVLNDVRSAVKLDQGIITMSPITAGLYNGTEVGTVVVNVRAQPVSYTVNSKLDRIDANQFLSSISSLREMLYGVMSASTNGTFTANGGASSIARTLNGNVSVHLADGKLANMDLLHQLATIGKFGRTARAVEPFTRLIGLNGDFVITNGVARTNNLETVIEDGSLAADGTVDLVDQKLNLRVTAVLSEEYSQRVGGTRIAGLMSTVLPNRQGEMVIPILLTGTFRNPQFAPDLAKIAQMKLQNLLPTMSNPDKLSTGILQEILRTRTGPQQPPPEKPQPENLLRDIFEGVFGKGSRGQQ